MQTWFENFFNRRSKWGQQLKAKGPVIRNRKKVSHVVENEISCLRNVFSSYAVISLLHFAHLRIIKLNETSNFFVDVPSDIPFEVDV